MFISIFRPFQTLEYKVHNHHLKVPSIHQLKQRFFLHQVFKFIANYYYRLKTVNMNNNDMLLHVKSYLVYLSSSSRQGMTINGP